MSNRFTTVTRNSWGSRIGNSIGGFIVGLILIPFCIWGLWNNEGTPDLSKLAKLSVVVPSDSVDSSKDGVFASISGTLTSNEEIGDDPYMVPGAYITLDRTSEIYAWKQSEESHETKDSVGGGSTTTTTYTYSKEWTSSPANSSQFKQPNGHENPAKSIENASYKVSAATIGAYNINPQTITLPDGEKIDVSPVEGIAGFFKNGNYLYTRDGANSEPQIGDMRISFTALKSGISVTALGKIMSGSIESYSDDTYAEGQRTLHRVFIGSRDDAITQLHNEYLLWIWIFRVLGVLGIWLGLMLLGGPIIKILDVVGVIGSVAEGVMGFVNFFVALAVGGTTIIVGMLFHNIYFLIATILLVIVGVVYYLRTHTKKAVANGFTANLGNSDESVNNTPPKMT